MRMRQFEVDFYQAVLTGTDVDSSCSFEVLSYDAGVVDATATATHEQASRASRHQLGAAREAHRAERRGLPAPGDPQEDRRAGRLLQPVRRDREPAARSRAPCCSSPTGASSSRPTSTHRVLGVLQIPAEEGVLRALDGQHRLLRAPPARRDASRPTTCRCRRSSSTACAPDQVVELFVTINAKHTKLNPSHLISLAGRRLYPDKALAASHDIIRALNEHADSPLHGEIKLFGVGRGRVAQAPLAEELKQHLHRRSRRSAAARPDRFRDGAQRFFLNYFKQIARVFRGAGSAASTASRPAWRCAPSCASSPTSLRGDRANERRSRSTRTPSAR